MVSEVSIVNRALTYLGANRITSLSDDTLEAKVASNMYAQSLNAILSECCWNFACKRELLVQIDESPVWTTDQMDTYFQLPSKLIRIFEVSDRTAKWRREGDRILANRGTFGILYVYEFTDTSKFSPAFIEAFAARLAYDMCYELTNSKDFASNLMQIYEGQKLPVAKAQDAQTGTPQEAIDDEWVNARFRGIDG